jgi:hypothetical protein
MTNYRTLVLIEDTIIAVDGSARYFDLDDEAGITHTFERLGAYYVWLLDREIPFKFVWDTTEKIDSRATIVFIHYYVEFENKHDQLMFELVWKGRYREAYIHKNRG